jgi:hypothetical protein
MSGSRSPASAAREVLSELNRGGPRLVTFTRGLALGALVGAAIAGTAMLDRRTRERRRFPADTVAEAPGDPPTAR